MKYSLLIFLVSSIAGIWATCPSNAVTGSDGSCFFVIPYHETFDNAEKFCTNYFQGHTGSIGNAFDNDLIQMMAEASTVNADYVWLGGQYDSGRVYWNDGSPDVYQNFRPAVPAGNILMNLSTGKWDTSTSRATWPFVCMQKAVPTIAPTTPCTRT